MNQTIRTCTKEQDHIDLIKYWNKEAREEHGKGSKKGIFYRFLMVEQPKMEL